jgi:GrpB-like predicted nucleotidyltransferase (UPF0157 family)
MILGLQRGETRLGAYNPEWKAEFEREKARLQVALGLTEHQIEHVGSTAVPGLAAKPIIDIAVAVLSFGDSRVWPDRLKREGYTYFGDRENRGDDFYAKGPEECRTVYLHVVEADGRRWKEYIFFRDTLRASASLREEYACLKLRLCAAHANERVQYTAAKAAWVAHVLEKRPNKSPEPTPTAVTPRATERTSK